MSIENGQLSARQLEQAENAFNEKALMMEALEDAAYELNRFTRAYASSNPRRVQYAQWLRENLSNVEDALSLFVRENLKDTV